MSIYNYISSGNITATVASDFNISGYIDRANDHIESIAYSLGVTPSGITTPVNFLLKEYAIAWCYREIYQDKIGANNIEIGESDKYLLLYNIQNDEVERLRKYLNPSIFTDTNLSPNTTASTVTLFRG